MKKLLALLLSLMMVLVLVPATVAEGEDFTLVIKGGNVDENLSMHGGKNLLAVDVALNSAVEDTLLTVTFDLTYNPDQITFVDYEKDDAFLSLRRISKRAPRSRSSSARPPLPRPLRTTHRKSPRMTSRRISLRSW